MGLTPGIFGSASSSGSQGGIFNSLGGFPGLGLAGLGVLSSILNRPQGLSDQQQALFNQILALINSPIRPYRPALLSGLRSAAQIGQGAETRASKDFAARGLGQSGIFGQALSDIHLQLIPQLQFQAKQDALQIGQQLRQQQVGNLLGLFGAAPQRTPGAFAAGTQGLAEMLAFLLFSGGRH